MARTKQTVSVHSSLLPRGTDQFRLLIAPVVPGPAENNLAKISDPRQHENLCLLPEEVSFMILCRGKLTRTVKKPHQYKLGTVALREIRRYQVSGICFRVGSATDESQKSTDLIYVAVGRSRYAGLGDKSCWAECYRRSIDFSHG